MENDCVIIYGDYYEVLSVLNSFPRLYAYMSMFISDGSDFDGDFGAIPICMEDVLEDRSYRNCRIVVSDDNRFDFVVSSFSKRYHIPKKNFIRFRRWVSYMLKKYNDILLIPESVKVDVCTKCQLNCPECYMRTHNNGVLGAGYTKFSVFKDFVDRNSSIRSMDIGCNGEVFLNPELDKILNYCHEKDIAITMSGGTNFNTVSEKALEALVTSQVIEVCISIDGATDDVYSQYRRNGNLNRVLRNIKKLNQYKEKYHSEYPHLRCQFIIMESNYHQLEDIAKLAEEYHMSIYYKKEWGNHFTPEDIEYVKQVTGLDYDESCNPNEGYCYQMIFSPQINWDGRLLGCVIVYRDDWGVNAFEDGLISSLNCNRYRDAICNLLDGGNIKDLKNPCIDCNSLMYDSINMNL